MEPEVDRLVANDKVLEEDRMLVAAIRAQLGILTNLVERAHDRGLKIRVNVCKNGLFLEIELKSDIHSIDARRVIEYGSDVR